MVSTIKLCHLEGSSDSFASDFKVMKPLLLCLRAELGDR